MLAGLAARESNHMPTMPEPRNKPTASGLDIPDPLEFLPQHSLGYLLRDTYRAFSKILQARISPHGVTIGQWYFLRVLWEEDGLTQRELSQRVGMMEPTTVTALNGMEKRGYVRRVRNATDRRKVNIFLTEKGRGLRAKLLPFAAEVNRIAAQALTPADIEKLRTILSAMKGSLEKESV
ncbi:MAG TPA: MarR family transcriptional regulator [Alphaproteobacteria bacterium]|jgi:DNA-binding MarR family transcriptional regulator